MIFTRQQSVDFLKAMILTSPETGERLVIKELSTISNELEANTIIVGNSKEKWKITIRIEEM